MNKSFKCALVAVLLPLFSLAFILFPGNVNSKKKKKGRLVIITKDKNKKKIDAPIFIKGKKKGKGKVTLKLKPGKYKIKFGNLNGYIISKPSKGSVKVKIKAGKKKTVTAIYDIATQNAPVASFTISPETGHNLTEFTFNASESTDTEDSSSKLKFRWDFDGDGTWDTSFAKTITSTNMFFVSGVYTISLEVKDTDSMVDTVTKTLTVDDFGWGANGGSAIQFVPDTGQTTDYTATFGEDSDYSINTPLYIDNGDGTISDTITGLMWQKTTDGATRTFIDAVDYCDNLSLADYTDWRLPTWKELVGIIDYGMTNPSLDATVFTGTNVTSFHWASTTNGNNGWRVGFYNGYAEGFLESTNYQVRAVRGGIKKEGFADNGDGTVTDNGTGLMWYQTTAGPMTWTGALDYCETLDAAGHTDWRLPTVKELASIIDNTKSSPAIDTTIFPGASSWYWTSTVFDDTNSLVWVVNFNTGGGLETHDKSSISTSNVLAVRLGN